MTRLIHYLIISALMYFYGIIREEISLDLTNHYTAFF
jgi:hypothetical protein